jgi:hypothetical protein
MTAVKRRGEDASQFRFAGGTEAGGAGEGDVPAGDAESSL